MAKAGKTASGGPTPPTPPKTPPAKKPNAIKGPIRSPNSKVSQEIAQEKWVSCGSLLPLGMAYVVTRKRIDPNHDGYNHPLKKGIDEADDRLIAMNMMYAALLASEEDPTQPAFNTGSTYPRRVFIIVRESDESGIPTSERRQIVQQTVDFLSTREANQFRHRIVEAPQWDLTEHTGPVSLDSVVRTQDVLLLLHEMYGYDSPDTNIKTLERNWAKNNMDTARMFFADLNGLDPKVKATIGLD